MVITYREDPRWGMLPSQLAYFLPICNVQEFVRSSSPTGPDVQSCKI